jgi:hypothetical protein
MIHYRRIKKVSKTKFLGTFNQSWPTHTHVLTHTLTHTHLHTHTHTHTHTNVVHTRTHTHTHTNVSTHTYSQITKNRGLNIEFVMSVVQYRVKLDSFILTLQQSGTSNFGNIILVAR